MGGRPFVRFQSGAHDLRRAGQPRLHRPERDSEGVRGVREREPEIVVEDDHRPLLRREPSEAAIELVTDRDGLLRIAGRGVHRPIDVQLDDGMAPVLLGGPVARPHEQPMEPRVEAIGVAQPSQVLPRADQRVLNGILGRSSSRRIRRATAKQATRAPRRQRRERIQVAIAWHEPQGRARSTTLRLGGERQPSHSLGPSLAKLFRFLENRSLRNSPRLLVRRPVRRIHCLGGWLAFGQES